MLKEVYPEHDWHPWRFSIAPKRLWSDIQTQRRFWLSLAADQNLPSRKDWYTYTPSDVRKAGGDGILRLFKNSVAAALAAAFPEHIWDREKFTHNSVNRFTTALAQRALLESAMKTMQLRALDDWYSITSDILKKNSKESSIILAAHGGSLWKTLRFAFPAHNWEPWRFRKLPQRYWDSHGIASPEFRSYMLEYLGQSKLRLQTVADWYRVSERQLQELSASVVISRFGGLSTILPILLPSHSWDPARFSSKGKKSIQRQLLRCLVELFPNFAIKEELRGLESASTLPKSSAFDFFIPDLKLALEYQGAHHYRDVTKHGDFNQKDATDSAKAAFCRKNGLTLIAVPFWWNGQLSQLANTIHLIRPDLFPSPLADGAPIP